MPSASTFLTMRAEVERDVESGEDAFGQPQTTVSTIASAMRCFVWPNSERTLLDGEKVASVGDYTMLTPFDADIRELDRIASVLDRNGKPILASEVTTANIVELFWGTHQLTWNGIPLVWETQGSNVIVGRLRVMQVMPRLGWGPQTLRYKEVGLELTE